MVKHREWLDKNYPNHSNRNIPNIKKVVADEPFEDLADFSMFIDLEELELVYAPNFFFGFQGENKKVRNLKIKDCSHFSMVEKDSTAYVFAGYPATYELDLTSLQGLRSLEVGGELKKEWARFGCLKVKVWSKRDLVVKSNSPQMIIMREGDNQFLDKKNWLRIIQSEAGQISELRKDLEGEKEKNVILEKQLDERISPEELAELLQTKMGLQSELEREKNKNKFLSEQLEEVLKRNEQGLEAKIEIDPSSR